MSDAHQMPTVRPSQVVKADAARRAQQAWAARVSGATWAETAELVGFADGPTALRAVRNFFGELPRIEREELRQLWRARLERLYGFADRDAEAGRPGALRAGVAIAQRAAAMDGLDEATRIEVSGDAATLDRMVRALLGGSAQEDAELFVDAEVIED